MFDNLQERLRANFKKLSNRGVITEENVKDALLEIKLALLEADVNYRVVNIFLKKIKERAVGEKIMKSLDPSKQLIKIVKDQLTELMGAENHGLNTNSGGTTLLMMVGLQGSGKTTSAAKLANRIKKSGKQPFLVPADVYRPAAIDQLKVLASQIGVPCFQTDPKRPVLEIVREAKKESEEIHTTHFIVDTAGRLQIDETMMNELKTLTKNFQFDEILFVADAMTGQEAVNVARKFNDALEISGIVLTKADGDARGGAALSIRAVTQKPIKFLGVGEKIEELEPFYPERLASKILGMGDILSLIERAEQAMDKTDMEDMEQRMLNNRMNLFDFETQLGSLQKMGSLGQLIKMIPGMGSKLPQNADLSAGENNIKKYSAILSSMTAKEKKEPNLLNASRKVRISKGSGTSVNDVNRLLKDFGNMKKMFKQMKNWGGKGGKFPKNMNLPSELKGMFS